MTSGLDLKNIGSSLRMLAWKPIDFCLSFRSVAGVIFNATRFVVFHLQRHLWTLTYFALCKALEMQHLLGALLFRNGDWKMKRNIFPCFEWFTSVAKLVSRLIRCISGAGCCCPFSGALLSDRKILDYI